MKIGDVFPATIGRSICWGADKRSDDSGKAEEKTKISSKELHLPTDDDVIYYFRLE